MSATGLKDSDQDKIPLSQRATIPPTGGDAEPTEDAATETDAMPKSVGQYEVKKLIGQGAMGVVYLARDNHSERDVALKIPTIKLGEESETLERFHREARSAATLSHPNICSIYQVGRSAGVNYIAMQYIDGRPLSDFVRPEDPPPVDQVALIVQKIADAMDQAHQKQIVHRDLKPDNILIDANREPVVMDFGLALNIGQQSDVRLTQAGTIMGSPAYMSPEQVENDLTKIGPPTDIYSLGVVFYELLTGKLPFEGSIAAVIGQIVNNEPKFPSQMRGGVHPTLDSICLKMMAKTPAGRFASMGEVAAALGAFLSQLERDRAKDPKQRDSQKVELTAFDRTKAVRDGRIERLEMAKRHVENLRKDGAYKEAIQILQQLSLLHDPRYAEYVRWARELIPVLRQEPERIRAQRAEAEDTARQLIDRHEYKEAIDLLQQIPRTLRTKSLNEVLKEAVKLHAECERLAGQITKNFKTHETNDTLPKVERLLELRPRSQKAQQWYFRLTGRKFGQKGWRNLPPKFLWPILAVALLALVGIGRVVYVAFSSGESPDSIPGVLAKGNAGKRENGFVRVDKNGNPGGNVVPPVKPGVEDPSKPGGIVAVGDAVDLLERVDPKKHKVAGTWAFKDNVLVNYGGLHSRLQFPYSPPEEYQLTVSANRLTDAGEVVIGLVKGERQFIALIDAGKRTSALYILDREGQYEKNESAFNDGPLLKQGVPAEIVCKVLDSGVSITVDGRTVIEWKGGFSRLLPHNGAYPVPNRSQLFIAGNKPFRFSKVELQPLKSPPVAVAVGEKVNLLTMIDLKKHKLSGDWTPEGDSLVTAGGLLQIPYVPPDEYELNITATRLGGKGGKDVVLGLRGGGKPFTAIFDFRERYTGLHVLDRNLNMIANKSAFDGRLFEEGLPAKINCRVLKSGVTLKVDGRTVVDWRGNFSRLSPYDIAYRAADTTRLFLASGRFRYSKIELQPLKSVAKVRKVLANNINLLQLINPLKHRIRGEWAKEGGRLVTTNGNHANLQIPYPPPEEYELRLTATRQSGNETDPRLNIGLVGGAESRHFNVALDARRNLSGLHILDGKLDIKDNVSIHKGAVIKDGIPAHVVCQVSKTGVKVTVNGRVTIDWSGSFSRLSSSRVAAHYPVPSAGKLSIGANCEFRFSNIELRPLPPLEQRAAARRLIIHDAQWGTCNGWLDVTRRVRAVVKDGRLIIPAAGAGYPDPRPGQLKALALTYRYGGMEFHDIVPAGSQIAVPSAAVIAAVDKTAADSKPKPRPIPIADSPAAQPIILRATWGAHNSWRDLTTRTRRSVQNGILRLHDVGRGYPKVIRRTPKTLVVVYRYRDVVQTATIAQGFKGAIDLRTIHLLKLVDPNEASTDEKWTFKDGSLFSPDGRNPKLRIADRVADEYDLRFRVQRLSGKGVLWIGAPVDGHQVPCYLDFSHQLPTSYSGVGTYDKNGPHLRPDAHKGELLKTNIPVDIMISVRKGSLAIHAGSKMIFQWKGDSSRFRLNPAWTVPQNQALYLGSSGSKFQITNLGLLEHAPKIITAAQLSTPVRSGTIPGGAAATIDLVLSPDGKALAAVGSDGVLRMWSTGDGQFLWGSQKPIGKVRRLLLGDEGRSLMWGIGFSVFSMSAKTKEIEEIYKSKVAILNVDVTRDGKRMAVCYGNGTIDIVDVAGRKLVKSIAAHTGAKKYIYTVSLSTDGRLVASGGLDKTFRISDVTTGDLVKSARDASEVLHTAFTPDGKTLAFGNNANHVKLWTLENGKFLAVIKHPTAIRHVAVDPFGKILATASADNTVRLFEIPSGKLMRELKTSLKQVNRLAYSADGSTLAAAGAGKAIHIWQIKTK